MANSSEPKIRHMKWWGWGHEDVSFSDADKPKLWPYLSGELGLEQVEPTPPVKFDDVHLPAVKEINFPSIKKTASFTPPAKRSAICFDCAVDKWTSRRILSCTPPARPTWWPSSRRRTNTTPC